MEKEFGINLLPIELKYQILLNVGYEEIKNCRLISQEYNEIIKSKYFMDNYIRKNSYTKSEIISDPDNKDFPNCVYQVHSSYLGNKKHGIEQWNRLEGGLQVGIYKLISWKNGLRSGEERIYLGTQILSSVNQWYMGKKEGEFLNFDPFNEGKIIQRFFYRNDIKEYEIHYTIKGEIGLLIQWNQIGKNYYSGSSCTKGRFNLILAIYAGNNEDSNYPYYHKISQWFEYRDISNFTHIFQKYRILK